MVEQRNKVSSHSQQLLKHMKRRRGMISNDDLLAEPLVVFIIGLTPAHSDKKKKIRNAQRHFALDTERS
jgi:hypothetical protein